MVAASAFTWDSSTLCDYISFTRSYCLLCTPLAIRSIFRRRHFTVCVTVFVSFPPKLLLIFHGGAQYIGNCCHATAPNQIFLSWITCDSANCCMFSLLLLQYILNFIGWSRAKIKIMHSNHVKQNETEWMSIIQLRKWYKKEQHRCMLRNSGKAHWFIALHHQPFLFRAYERFDSAQAQHNVYCSRNACNKDKKT